MRHLYFISIIFLLVCSCATPIQLTTINVRNAAAVTFPPEVVNVVVVDNSPSIVKPDKLGEKGIEVESILVEDSVRTLLLESFVKFMNEEGYFNKVELYPYRTNNGKSEKVIPLTKRKIQAICVERDADALISLDLLTNSNQIETEDVGYFSNYSILATKLGALVRVYSKLGTLYGKPIVYMDSLFREERVDWSRIRQSIPEINNLMSEIAVVGADKLTGSFIPSWQNQERWYYAGYSKDANRMAKQEKWKEAADIWSTLYENEKNTNKKVRLTFNIALANEYLDDVEKSLSWINQAQSLLLEDEKSDLAQQVLFYKKILEKRKASMNILLEQLGGNDAQE